MFTTGGYGSISADEKTSATKAAWRQSAEQQSRAYRSQMVFILLLIATFSAVILLSIFPLKQKLPANKLEDIDPSQCEAHICLYDLSDVQLSNEQMQLLQNHPSTISEQSKFAAINRQKFISSPHELIVQHPEGMSMSLPLISYRGDGLYYFQDEDNENRFLLSMSTDTTDLVEGFASCQEHKYELHSIGDAQFYLLIEKNWIQDDTNWCGVFDILSKPEPVDAFNDDASNVLTENNNQDMAMWLTKENMITNYIGLDSLLIYTDSASQAFRLMPLCSDMSPFDGNVYCVVPSNAGDTWTEFDTLRFYAYNVVHSQWTEMVDDTLDLGDSSMNLPQSMCVCTDNEIYAFSVNPVDATVAVYSYTTSWRLHHYTPAIGGDIANVEIQSVYVDDVLYFSVNEYDALGSFTIYHYTDDIFSVFDTQRKSELPVYTHCMTEFEQQLLVFYVDYGHNLVALYQQTTYNLGFNLANNIMVNQFQCIATDAGNVLSWRYESNVYYLQLSPDSFQQIVSFSKLPWSINSADDENNLFQFLSLSNSIADYKSVSIYYTEDVVLNYLSNVQSIAMDVSSIISLSNILYAMQHQYGNMMQIENVLLYDNSAYDDDGAGGEGEIGAFTSFEGASDINILLVDAMDDDDEIGYSQCDDADQSFAVVQYSAF